jgi:hypothetical protein
VPQYQNEQTTRQRCIQCLHVAIVCSVAVLVNLSGWTSRRASHSFRQSAFTEVASVVGNTWIRPHCSALVVVVVVAESSALTGRTLWVNDFDLAIGFLLLLIIIVALADSSVLVGSFRTCLAAMLLLCSILHAVGLVHGASSQYLALPSRTSLLHSR